MKIGSLKEALLSSARDTYLFDCRVAGEDPQAMSAYRDVLGCFIRFTGNILVKELTPDHVRMYIANLSDGPSEGEEHIRTVINHYSVIHDWVRWLCAQKFITQRSSEFVKPPRYLTRRFFMQRGAGGSDAGTRRFQKLVKVELTRQILALEATRNVVTKRLEAIINTSCHSVRKNKGYRDLSLALCRTIRHWFCRVSEGVFVFRLLALP